MVQNVKGFVLPALLALADRHSYLQDLDGGKKQLCFSVLGASQQCWLNDLLLLW